MLGAYSKTWPLDCPKSKRIIEEAAAFYADPKKFKEEGIPGALACLFLLSTGDDKYLPRVKAYLDAFPKDVRAIGDHTWNNGYNGIPAVNTACAPGTSRYCPFCNTSATTRRPARSSAAGGRIGAMASIPETPHQLRRGAV